MDKAALERLVCPQTNRSLKLCATKTDGDKIIEGLLLRDGKTGYAITGGVPQLMPPGPNSSQTIRSFAQKWDHHRYYREHTRDFYTNWYLQRYGFAHKGALSEFLADKTVILDAGTGSGRDALNFAELSAAMVYGIDTSPVALEVARTQIDHPRVAFVQADLNKLPFTDEFFDFISCDQVIHHTADPHQSFGNLARKLRPGGVICCYVYRQKAAIREFTDDYVRERISHLSFAEAAEVCEGITKLGKALAGINATIDIEEDIPILGIEKGTIDIQRFIHWNIMKCFWNDEFDFHTNNVVNVDWYHPEYCHRFTPEAFRAWFDEGWTIEHFDVQPAGISCRARKA